MTYLPWRRVWTLNIDDTFENAYGKDKPEERKLQVVDWQDPYSESGDLQVIHLHGHIMGHEPRTLVFSFTEYQSAARSHPVWDQVLGGVIGTEPFLVIGAKMLDDQDVEALLMQNPPRGTAPSFVVDPFISPGNKWELEQLGFIVLEDMPENVLRNWQESFDLGRDSLSALRRSSALAVPQFSKLQTNLVRPAPKDHDFYGGDAPLWSDVVGGRIATFQWMKEVIEHFERWLDTPTPDPVLHIVYGNRLTGTSSGLLAVARESIRLNATTYLFDKSSRWDIALAVDLAKEHPTVFLIDGAADFADDIDRTLKMAKEQGASLYLLATELPRNDLRFEGRLVGQYAKSVTSSPERLDRIDSSALAAKLENFGRLGSLELKDKRERTRHFFNRDVFSAMMEVEYALGFRKRLEGELSALDPDWRLDLALLLSLAAQGNRTVGLVDAAIAIGTSTETITTGLREDEHLSALIEHVEDRLVARQRGGAVEPAINALGPDIALRKLLGFIQRLAPLASRASLQRRNRVPLLVGHLMTTRNVQTAFPNHDLDDFYEALRPTFGDWNGRYWEQRAIYAKSISDWSRAESFAARSVSLYDDAYTRTTYGTVLINKAENLASLDDPAWQGYYNRGREQLEAARLKEPGSRVTAFAFLEATLALLQHLSRRKIGSDAVRSVAADWKASYASLRVSLAGEKELQSISRTEKLGDRWERLAPHLT
ncbi:SIR2 family protein [Micromonospora sp. BL1]|uniref:P-loop NTPase n=1 Tax=Micromonospora sp. BL1 TaxID=2478709 RepID=UPI0013156105|nr:SIR2 family protein [Micromonospora sp. BL1]